MKKVKTLLGYAAVFCKSAWGDRQNIEESLMWPEWLPDSCLGGLPPFTDDIQYDFYTRGTGSNELQDRDSSAVASVVGGYVVAFDGVSDYNIGVIGLTDWIIELDFYATSMTDNRIVCQTSGGTSEGGAISLYLNRLAIYDNGWKYLSLTLSLSTWYHVKLEYESNVLKTYIDGVLIDTRTLSNPITFDVNDVGVGARFSTAHYGNQFSGLMKDVIIKNIRGVELHNYRLNGHTINSINGVAATNNGVTFTLNNTDKLQSTQDALDKGYYELSTGEKVINPQYSPTGGKQHSGGKLHNLIDSYIIFPNAPIFDRSNTTSFNATARASAFYDSSAPTKFHISEIDYDTLQGYYEAAFKERNFARYMLDYCYKYYLDEIATYNTQKTGQDLTDVLAWANYRTNCPPSDCAQSIGGTTGTEFNLTGHLIPHCTICKS